MAEPSPVPGRTLILLRHAKAERESGLADVERSLTSRGRADAYAAGAWLVHQGIRPDQVICSPARRTRQTWTGVGLGLADAEAEAEADDRTLAGVDDRAAVSAATPRVTPADEYEPIVSYEPLLYHGTPGDLLKLIRATAPEVGTLLVIGHNPTVSEVSELLDPAHGAGDDWIRTCELVVHRSPEAWADVRPGSAPVLERHTARAV